MTVSPTAGPSDAAAGSGRLFRSTSSSVGMYFSGIESKRISTAERLSILGGTENEVDAEVIGKK